ncbi:transmembrane protein [Thalictrum thalictroides]|uniref:Transmembrane protein n=1 Tax=Thalictrum thalictroides TaxID=46969 RepID=A0A7J6X2D5_THATH|nr:transmembrane protein [Thalictrum thalictroides]
MLLESGLGDMLMKVGMFLLVQALVYFILTSSSNVFSKNMRSVSFKTARSVSIRRIMAAISDLPIGAEPSPTPPTPAAAATRTSSYEYEPYEKLMSRES